MMAATLLSRQDRRFRGTGRIAAQLRLNPTGIAPSGLNKLGFSTDDLLTVADAMASRPAVAVQPKAAAALAPKDRPAPDLTRRPRPEPQRSQAAKVERRAPDVRLGVEDTVRAMFARDEELVRSLTARGGMPRAEQVGGKTVWLDMNGGDWLARAGR